MLASSYRVVLFRLARQLHVRTGVGCQEVAAGVAQVAVGGEAVALPVGG